VSEDPSPALELLARERRRAPTVVDLARALAVAARIEPALLRTMRLALFRQSDVGLESDLWWSALVQARDPVAMTLRADIRRALQAELRQPERREELLRSWKLIERAHAAGPPVLRLEERATFLSLAGQLADMERFLGGALAAVAEDSSGKMARWVSRALPRLPEAARRSEASLALARAASDHLGRAIPGILEAEDLARSWSPGMLRALPRTTVSIALRAGHGDEGQPVGYLSIGSTLIERLPSDPLLHGLSVEVPSTRPLIIDVMTPTETGWIEQREAVPPDGQVELQVPLGPAIRIRTLLGEERLLKPHPSIVTSTIVATVGPHSALLGEVAADLGWVTSHRDPAGIGKMEEWQDRLQALLEERRSWPPNDLRRFIRAHLLQRDRECLERWLSTGGFGGAPPAPFTTECDLLERRRSHFVLWRPAAVQRPPELAIRRAGSATRTEPKRIPLRPAAGRPDLWEIPALECGLRQGECYQYWFVVENTWPEARRPSTIFVPDPTAWTLDPRVTRDDQPAAIVRFEDGRLWPCDPDGAPLKVPDRSRSGALPSMGSLVIYHVPFRTQSFAELSALLAPPSRHLMALGINALRMAPADWGVSFAPQAELGPPSELVRLIEECHRHFTLFVAEMTPAFAVHSPYANISYSEFHVARVRGRDGFGGNLFDYNTPLDGYDPMSGGHHSLVPARQLMMAQLVRWLRDFDIDGVSYEGVWNIDSWDFVGGSRALTWALWNQLHHRPEPSTAAPAREFFFIGEHVKGGPYAGDEPHPEVRFVVERRADATANVTFTRLLRRLLVGEVEGTFADSVHRLIDCRLLGFARGIQALNAVTMYGGSGPDGRLLDDLRRRGIIEAERRIKLAFAALLTAIGIPVIFAGEEFADEQDIANSDAAPSWVVDRPNYHRLEDPFRQRVFQHVARLVKLRTRHPALSSDHVRLIHVDTHDHKRVAVWERGKEGGEDRVVVVANFSDYGTPQGEQGEYRVPGWPGTPPGRRWREVTQDRVVSPNWVGREPIWPWEAKVYVLEGPG
jgi:hypothetical protein